MAHSYLSLRMADNSFFATRFWNPLMQELERRTIRVTTPLLLQEGISGGSMLSILGGRGLGGGGGSPETFTVYSSGVLKVKVRGGTVLWDNQRFFVPDSDPEITVPANSTNFKVWIGLDDAYNPGAVGFAAAADGWPNFPNQPTLPGVKYILLCTITSDDTDVTDIDMDLDGGWHGGDIIWPGALIPEVDDFSLGADLLNVKVNGGKVFWQEKDFTVADGSVFAIPANSTNWKIYLQLNNGFSPTSVGLNSAATVPSNAGIAPGRIYTEVAELDTNDTRVTRIRRHFRGGTWVSIYGYHI